MSRATRPTVGAQARRGRTSNVLHFPRLVVPALGDDRTEPHADNGGDRMDYDNSDATAKRAPRATTKPKKSRFHAASQHAPRSPKQSQRSRDASLQLRLPAPSFARLAVVTAADIVREVVKELYGVRWQAHCALGRLEENRIQRVVLESRIAALAARDRELSNMLEAIDPAALRDFNIATSRWRTATTSAVAYGRAACCGTTGGDSCT